MRRIAHVILSSSAIALLLAGMLGYCGDWHWGFDLLANFRLQMLLAAGLLLVLALMLRARFALALTVLALGANGFAVAAVETSSGQAAASPPLRVVAINLLGDGRRLDDVIAWLRQQRFDVVTLEELTPGFADQLQALADIYPYKLFAPARGGFGIGILSRHAMAESDVLRPGLARYRALRATVAIDGRTLEIVAVHPPPPMSWALAAERDDYYAGLARILPPRGERIVLGDFNSSLWTAALRRFRRDLDLRAGSIVPRLTWPSTYATAYGMPLESALDGRGFIWPLGVPIDHILAGRGLLVAPLQLGPALGSDHYPVTAEIRFVAP